jgi:hypothetical protein
MTDPATLLALAERCEQAAGPDAGLDLAIWTSLLDTPGFRPPSPWRTDYTASLDAALTLVPEGCGYQIISGFDEGGLSHASVYVPEIDNGERGDSATTALALCAAALRARYVKP